MLFTCQNQNNTSNSKETNIAIPKRTLARLKEKTVIDTFVIRPDVYNLWELSGDCNDLQILSLNTERQTIKDSHMQVETSDSDSPVCASDREN